MKDVFCLGFFDIREGKDLDMEIGIVTQGTLQLNYISTTHLNYINESYLCFSKNPFEKVALMLPFDDPS